MTDRDQRPVVRLMTWNIHRGIGPDRVCDFDRVVALIRKHAPDIVALQEVDSRPDWGREAAFDVLAEALGPYSAAAKAIAAPDGDYGHMLISRWPLAEVVQHDLSVEKREPRRAIQAAVATPFGPLRLITAHLGLFPAERRHQAAILARTAGAAAEPLVVAGDFNDWRRRGPVTSALSRVMPGRTEIATFPAKLPLGKLDRIYCRPAGILLASWTDRSAREASDHLPLIAEIAVTS